MSPRVGGEEKSGKILTKFVEHFGESPNLVKNQVIKLSQNLVKLNVVILFSPNLVILWGCKICAFWGENMVHRCR